MPPRWSFDEAMASVEGTPRAVDQRLPYPTSQGCHWACSACPFICDSVPDALTHAEVSDRPFDHVLYERRDTFKVGRRACRGAEGTAVIQARPGHSKPKRTRG